MAGFRRNAASDDYVFVDGRAVHRSELSAPSAERTLAPGEEAARGSSRGLFGRGAPSRTRDAGQGAMQGAPQAASPATARGAAVQNAPQTMQGAPAQGAPQGAARAALQDLSERDAFELRGGASSASVSPAVIDSSLAQDRQAHRRKTLVFALVLLVVTLFSLCISESYYFTLNAPGDVAACIGSWFHLTFVRITNYASFAQAQNDVVQSLPMYHDVMAEVLLVLKYLACGAMLALSGMLYQNVFRNPIAAPSMLGVTNGINLALLILVLQIGTAARARMDLYYLYAYIGGAAILALVILGSRWMSGKGSFSVVNMILIGTVLSQMIGVFIQYVEVSYMTDETVYAYQLLQMAADQNNVWTFVTLGIGLVVSLVPVIALRFRLNLISFGDDEVRLLGVNPNVLRIVALVSGSIMILTAQVNAGQVAMASLVVPFIARAVFGAEFRKQLVGCVLIGALVLLVCGDVVNFFVIYVVPLDLGSVVTILALPLFVWMLVIQQKSWE